MSTILDTLEHKFIEIVSSVQELKATYDYPTLTFGRQLPALVVLYNGFAQEPFTHESWLMEYAFTLTLYLPLEGTKIESKWAENKKLALKVVSVFRADQKLDGLAVWSLLDKGKPIIEVPAPTAKPKWIGHDFSLYVKVEE
jgi:hypothetical protein